jgi:hypothetical protein
MGQAVGGPIKFGRPSLVGAVGAIRMATLGRGLWEPDIREFQRAPIRIAGVLAMVAVAITFGAGRRHPNFDLWIPWVVTCVAAALFFFLADIFCRQWLIVKCKGMTRGIIGGIWTTQRARDILKGDPRAYDLGDLAAGEAPPPGPVALYCSFASPRDATRVWPPTSMAAGTILVVLVYCLWNALATTAVAVAATLIAIVISSG